MGVTQHDCCPHKTIQIWADGHAQKENIEDSHVLMETDAGVMVLQVKEHLRISGKYQQPEEARKNSVL